MRRVRRVRLLVIVRLIAKRVKYPQDAGLSGGPAYQVPYDLWRLGLVEMRPQPIGNSGAYVLQEKVIVEDTTEIPSPPHPTMRHRSWLS